MWSLRVTPIVGLPTYTDWSQAATLPLVSGKFVILLSVRGQSAAVLGQSVLSEISATPPDSAQAVYTLLTALLKKYPEDKLSVACLLLKSDKVALGAVRASILLHRDTTTGRVLPASHEVSLRSGTSKTDDVYILLNEQGEQFVPAIEQHFAHGLIAEAVATTLVPAVQSSGNQSGTGAIALVEVIEQVVLTQEKMLSDSIEPSVSKTAVPDLVEPEPAKNAAWRSLVSQLLTSGKHRGAQLWSTVRSLKLRRNVVYVRTTLYDHWRKRALLIVGVLLAALGTVMGFWWWYNSSQTAVQTELAPLEERLAAAQQVVEDDPLAARQAAAQVVAELEVLVSTKGKQRLIGSRYTQALAQAQVVLTTLSGKVAIVELPVFYDLRLVQSEMVTTTSHLSDKKGVFIDAEKKQVVVLDLTSKQVQLHSLTELPKIQATTVTDDALFLLGEGLWQLRLTDNTQLQAITLVGDSNRAGTLLGSFGSYRYVLNPEKRNVFRYTQTADGVSEPIGWITDPLPVGYETVASLAIDGDIWFGTTSGELLRYASGKRQTVTLSGLEEAFTSSLLLATTAESPHLYVLEAGKQRLVILSKMGTFLREVRSPSLATVTSFFVDEAGGFAYLTSGSTVYQIALVI